LTSLKIKNVRINRLFYKLFRVNINYIINYLDIWYHIEVVRAVPGEGGDQWGKCPSVPMKVSTTLKAVELNKLIVD